jgi:uncharacterized protein VirK/YbjX
MIVSAVRETSNDSKAASEPQRVAARGDETVHLRRLLSKIIKSIRGLENHGLKQHIQFIVAALRRRGDFMKLADPVRGEALERLVADRPRYLSLLIAPYMDARWSTAERVDRLIEHATTLRKYFRKYDFAVDQSLYLFDLNEVGIPNYSVIIDKPEWFCHEGLLTLNLCHGNFRLFSMTFSFFCEYSVAGMVIGGIQGRKTSDILQRYRQFTKLASGLEPRDFILEVLRIIARVENVQTIKGTPDQFRYNRHEYFSKIDRLDLFFDYDDVWKERGGFLNDDGMYEIPLTTDRAIERIAAKKRSLYRRRYEMLDQLEDRIALNLQASVPVDRIPLD